MMIRNLLIGAVVLLALGGCSTKRKIVAESHTAHHIDTMKRQTDSVAVRVAHEMRAAEVEAREDSTHIAFVAGGGVVLVDSAGRIALQGVASIRIRRAHQQHRETDTAATYSRDSVSSHVAAGVSDSTTSERRKEVERKGISPPFRWLVLGVIVAFCVALVYRAKR